MHETAGDVDTLQRLLDDSYASIGEHMRGIHTPERRVNARDLVDVLRGVRVLNLATVSARCEPRVGPVDGHFYRGQFYFGSSPQSVRFRHLRARPQVSAAHTVGETFAVVVHGRAREIDVRGPEWRGYFEYLHEVYPHWDEWWPADGPTPAYARIDADRMYAYAFEPPVLERLRQGRAEE